MKYIAFFILIFPIFIGSEHFHNFIIWNVGQGSWSTFIEKEFCYHIDMGGERFDLNPMIKRCKKQKNLILLTHLDWDHINKIKKFQRKVKNLCLFPHPEMKKSSRASRWLKNIRVCNIQHHEFIKLIHKPHTVKSKNQSSLVYVIKKQVLISGDSPISEEKKWSYKLRKKMRVLILGHHGSKTSTSHLLMSKTKFNMGVASARKKRFGHPHKKVIKRLKKFKSPLLKTEDWGHIHFEI